VVITGPSGVGKDAALKRMRLLERPWHFTVTATTRPRRPQERDGVDYIFLEPERFHEMLKAGEFLEYAQVYGYWYGVPRQQVREALERGLDVIMKVDVQGASTIKRLVPQGVFIFLAPPSMEELERRLRQRKTESPKVLETRLKRAREEMECLPMFDYLVVNQNGRLDEAVACIDAIITAEKCRIPPRRIAL
jgi:guanylate kinase